jgi:hypothetical protein
MLMPEDAASHLGSFKGKLPGLLETTKEFSGKAGAACDTESICEVPASHNTKNLLAVIRKPYFHGDESASKIAPQLRRRPESP